MRTGCLIPLLLLNLTHSLSRISPQYYQSQSCTLHFDNGIRTLNTKYKIVSGYQFISSFNECQVTRTQISDGWISAVVPYSADKLLYCNYGDRELVETDLLLEEHAPPAPTVSSELQNICEHMPAQTEVFRRFGEDVYTAIIEESRLGGSLRKYNTVTGSITKSYMIHMENIKNYLGMFERGDYLYTVYLKDDGRGYVSRVCKDDTNRLFYSYQFGALSCQLSQVSHQVFLDLHYDPISDRLYVLATRHPAHLSIRILCRYNLQDIDEVFNTGSYLYYDELGNAAYKAGQFTACSNQHDVTQYTELADQIISTEVLVSKLEAYSSFCLVNLETDILFYLTVDNSLDIYKLNKVEDKVKHVQKVLTEEAIARVRTDGESLFVVRNRTIDVLSPYLCGHVTDPVQCYSENNFWCAWSEQAWECREDIRCDGCQSRERSFHQHFPNGLIRRVSSGCHTETTFYTSTSTTSNTQVHRCPLPPDLPNVRILRLNNTCRAEVEVECMSGTTLVAGDLLRTCREDGSWSGNRPVCLEKRCNSLVVPRDSYLSSRATHVGSVVTLTCADKCYTPETDIPLLCSGSGQWNSTRLPACKRKSCLPLPTPINTLRIHSDTRCGEVVRYKCKDSYSLLYGNLKRKCQPDGTWDGSVPFCKITHCPSLPAPRHGLLIHRTTKVGDIETQACNACYKIEQRSGFRTSANTQCLKTGKWSHSYTCKPVQCPILVPNLGSTINFINNSCTGRAEFGCLEGHELVHGSLVRHCLANGRWSGVNPTCKRRTCSTISTPALYNNVEMVEYGNYYQDRAYFQCKAGTFLYNGSLELQCKNNGEWSNKIPVCQPAHVLFPELQEGPTTIAAPEDLVARNTEKSGSSLLLAFAVIGWAMFLASAVIVGFIVYVRQKPVSDPDTDIDDGTPEFNRQITQSTTTSHSSTLGK